MPGADGGQLLGDLAGLLRAQRDRAAYCPQAASVVVAAEDQELRGGVRVPVMAPTIASVVSRRHW
ncbi:hypothetical protein ACWGHA_33815 [Streptomyces xanthophaeus]